MADEEELPPFKVRKLQGAATYSCKYNSSWKKEFPFIGQVSGDPYR